MDIVVSPNPFTSNCRIIIEPPILSAFQISITDLFGRSVKEFHIRSIDQIGAFEMNWDGNNNEGNELASGVYFLTVTDNMHHRDAIKIIKY
jgi:flagellar hook assembly protein FlgD